MNHMGYSRWMGPLVGTLCGVGVTAFTGIVGKDGGALGFWPPLFMGAGIGFAGGLLVMLADPRTRPEPGAPEEKTEPNFGGNAIAILGLLSFFMPLFGLVLSVMGLCQNWSSKRWAWYVGWVALVLSLLMNGLFIYAWTHPSPH